MSTDKFKAHAAAASGATTYAPRLDGSVRISSVPPPIAAAGRSDAKPDRETVIQFEFELKQAKSKVEKAQGDLSKAQVDLDKLVMSRKPGKDLSASEKNQIRTLTDKLRALRLQVEEEKQVVRHWEQGLAKARSGAIRP